MRLYDDMCCRRRGNGLEECVDLDTVQLVIKSKLGQGTYDAKTEADV